MDNTKNLFTVTTDDGVYMTKKEAQEKLTVKIDDTASLEALFYFTDGSWLSETGEYYASYGEFFPYGEDPGEDYINRMNQEVQTMFRVSSMVFRNDYFSKRSFITTPEDSLEDE